jgi:hypothetical protein
VATWCIQQEAVNNNEIMRDTADDVQPRSSMQKTEDESFMAPLLLGCLYILESYHEHYDIARLGLPQATTGQRPHKRMHVEVKAANECRHNSIGQLEHAAPEF